MKCPNCQSDTLVTAGLSNIQVHTCNTCHGYWITRKELEVIKDRIPQDAWFDLDIWDDSEKMKATKSDKICPVDNIPLSSLEWDNSHIVIEVCIKCNGIWLDRGEFKKVVKYIDDTANDEILFDYKNTLGKKIEEVFTGPQHVIKEVHDVWSVLNMFGYKLMAQEPELGKALVNSPII
jgi:Zn-finger nucleic acid-binding protein